MLNYVICGSNVNPQFAALRRNTIHQVGGCYKWFIQLTASVISCFLTRPLSVPLVWITHESRWYVTSWGGCFPAGIPEQLRDKFDENKLKMTTEYGQEGDMYSTTLTPGPGMPPIVETFKLDVEFDSKDLLGVPTKVGQSH